MRPWGSRAWAAVRDRWALLRVSARQSDLLETAYFTKNWASSVAPFAYTVAYIVFFQALFGSISTFAGYSHGEILFMLFAAQLTYYVLWMWGPNNLDLLEMEIRNGTFDLLLVRPLPLLWFIHTRRIDLRKALRQGVAPLTAITVMLPWRELPFTPASVAASVVVFACGQLAFNAVQSILLLPAFWLPGVRPLVHLPYDLNGQIPVEAYPRWLALTFTFLLPVLLGSAVAAETALGRFDLPLVLAVSITSTIFILWARARLWGLALRSYTSASS